MKLRHIEVFHAVYTTGSVSAAARQLNVSQPAVTNLLRHAESTLGFTLFERVRGRLVPTSEAHELFEQAHSVQEQVYRLGETARNIRLGQGQLLRLSTLPSLGIEFLAQEVARFALDHPGSLIELNTIHNDQVASRLYERQTDLVFCYTPPRGIPVTSIELGHAEMVVYYPEDLLPDAPSRITLADIAGLPFVSTIESGPLGRAVADDFAKLGIEPATIGKSGTFAIAAAMAHAANGATIVDGHTAKAMERPGMTSRPLDPPQSYEIHACHLFVRPPPRLALEFIAHVKGKLDATGRTANP